MSLYRIEARLYLQVASEVSDRLTRVLRGFKSSAQYSKAELVNYQQLITLYRKELTVQTTQGVQARKALDVYIKKLRERNVEEYKNQLNDYKSMKFQLEQTAVDLSDKLAVLDVMEDLIADKFKEYL